MIFFLLVYFCVARDAIVIDHNDVDELDDLDDRVFAEAREVLFLHYAHTSHGSQLLSGTEYLSEQDIRYTLYENSYSQPATLPDQRDPPGLLIFDGMENDDYVSPELYWNSESGRDDLRDILDTGLFTYTMWSFCGEMAANAGPSYAESYTSEISSLEEEYPDIGFIYMTGHLAGSSEYAYSDSERENLRLNNEYVRYFVTSNDKILYDFADIEAYDESGNICLTNSNGLSNYNDYPVECDWPSEPDFYCSHTVGYNCMRKAQAFWYMIGYLAENTGSTCYSFPLVLFSLLVLFFVM